MKTNNRILRRDESFLKKLSIGTMNVFDEISKSCCPKNSLNLLPTGNYGQIVLKRIP